MPNCHCGHDFAWQPWKGWLKFGTNRRHRAPRTRQSVQAKLLNSSPNSGRPLELQPTSYGSGSDRLVGSETSVARPSIGSSPLREIQQINVLGAVWRYRWAVLLPATIAAIIGFLIYLQLPETYRSTTRLMVRTDRPAVLDQVSGDMVGGVPSIDIVTAQLYSDTVVARAFSSPRMEPYRERFRSDFSKFMSDTLDSLILEPEVEDIRTAQSLVILQHFEHTDQELCKAAVESFSDALQSYYNDQMNDTRGELMSLINNATEKLAPKLIDLERRYREFRTDAPLAWASDGTAINPHRERQLFLVQRRSELVEEKRKTEIQLASVKSIARDAAKDPLLALNIIGQLIERKLTLPDSAQTREDIQESDETLGLLNLDTELVPLMVQKSRLVAEYGPDHPSVRSVATELELMKQELKELVEKKAARVTELVDQYNADYLTPGERSVEAVKAVVFALEAQTDMLGEQITELDSQIAAERTAAATMARYEQDNASMMREIERTQELLDQLEEEMSRVALTDEQQGVRVVELTAPSEAYRVGPNLVICLGLSTLVGLALGCGIALLLENNANTFRDPDEIGDALRAPVWTHMPFFKGKVAKGDENPYRDLDPQLAVIHTPISVAAEAMRQCRTTLFFETAGNPRGTVIQLTSPLPSDGKSMIACNLAASIAQSGKKTLLIDCDLRRPQTGRSFNIEDEYGLTHVLNGECELTEAIHDVPCENLSVMPSGPIPANPAEALTLPDMYDMMEHLKDQYDYIVLDTPPLLVVTDPSIVASLADGVILAMRVRRKSKPNAREAANILRSVGANFMGIVINNSDESASSDGYRGHGYYRYSKYTNRYQRRRDQSERVTVSGRGGQNRLANLSSASPHINGAAVNGSASGPTLSGGGSATGVLDREPGDGFEDDYS